MRSSTRLLLTLSLVILALSLFGWLVSSVGDLHDRVARVSPPLAIALVTAAVVALLVTALVGGRLLWRLGRSDRSPPAKKAPADVIRAAEVQAQHAEALIAQVRDESKRSSLASELDVLRVDRAQRRFHVVIFGTGSAGKTSLINALLGRAVGATAAPMGTTQHGEEHTYLLEGVEGTLALTDTPGLSEIGSGGGEREAEARALAARADLLLFVVDHDLIRSEYDPLLALARQGKRSIVVLNKKDLFADADREAILAKLRERLAGVVPAADIVAVAASPRPTRTRVRGTDGATITVLETEPPDLGELARRVEAILKREGEQPPRRQPPAPCPLAHPGRPGPADDRAARGPRPSSTSSSGSPRPPPSPIPCPPLS